MQMNDLSTKKIVSMDIETLAECFLYGDKEMGVDGYNIFIISNYQNQLDALVKYLLETSIINVGFNNRDFDGQVIQYILDNYDQWYDYSNQQVIDKIYQFAQELISNQDYEIRPPYRESYMDIPQIDLFQILGYENKNKRTSLKWIEFSLDMEVEEMPIHHAQRGLTETDIELVVEYWKKDIKATEELYRLVRGNTSNSLYAGKDKIQERIDVIAEMGFKPEAMNYSDVRLGETINLVGYMKEANIQHMGKLYELKKNRGITKKFTFGDCIPKYVKFQTEKFKEFHKYVKSQPFMYKADPAQEFILTHNRTAYSIMKGGIHSHDSSRILEGGNGIVLRDADVGSQYPNAINKRKLYPSHLGPKWNKNYEKNIIKRLEYKVKGKDDPKYKGLAETWKLALNGGGFGKLNDNFSVQYDPFPHFQCTIGNQFEILMLIESLEVAGIDVVSANTDGIVCQFKEELSDRYYEICKEWELIVGNDKMGQLEYTDYKKLIQTSVNDYIAMPVEGKVKFKGDFDKDKELHKNKSNRIVPIAMEKYYIHGIAPEETISKHQSIWDFCCAKKASKDYYYEGVDRKTGNTKKYNKLIRYYCSTQGEKIYKVKHEYSDKKGSKRSQVESTSQHQVLFNIPFKVEQFSDYKIDQQYYLNQVYKILDQIEPLKGLERKEKAAGVITLF